jgi:hypothetical protein
MVEAFTGICTDLEVIGHKPKFHVIDNECSRAIQNFLNIKKNSRQNVEAHHHNATTAKPSVKAAKYHIISHIDTIDASCSIQLWSKLSRKCKTY